MTGWMEGRCSQLSKQIEEAKYRTSVLTRNFPFLLYFLHRVLRKILDIRATFLFSFVAFLKKRLSQEKHIWWLSSLFLFARHGVWPRLEPQTASGKATEECLIWDSTAARGCPCPQMSAPSKSIYNDINDLRFPQVSVQLHTQSTISSQLYLSRNNL